MRHVRMFTVALLVGASLVVVGVAPTTAAEPLFTRTEGFATKTGFRGVFTWETSAPARGVVHYGRSPDELSFVAQALTSTADTAGMAVAYFGPDADTRWIGETFYWQVEDELTGEVSEIKTITSTNAYTDWDEAAQTYTIDLLVQLDTESLPPDVPFDMALRNAADGMNIFAERLYDATDGYVRLGKVLVTDTNLDYPFNPPFIAPACETEQSSLADVLIQTTIPFDSHTWAGWSIDDACIGFYVGRLGQLVVPWGQVQDEDLHFGYVSTHELAHYALNAPDLYDTANIEQSAPNYGDDLPWCKNLAWDGSLMNNSGGWAGGRWELTELDRNPTVTPCDHEGEPSWSWSAMTERYDKIPAEAENLLDHVVDTKARGNEDGGALEILILDREPGSSTLDTYMPNDGVDVQCGSQDPQIVDPLGDANEVAVTQTPLPSEPSLDVDRGFLTASSSGAAPSVTFTISVPALPASPAGFGDHFRFYFTYNSVDYQVRADRSPLGTTYRLQLGDNTAITGATVTGAHQPATEAAPGKIEMTVPSQPALTWVQTAEVSGLQILAQRNGAAVVITADTATAQCSYLVGQELAINAAPVAGDDEVSTRMMTAVTIDAVANDSDPDGDALQIASTSSPGAGTASVEPGGQIVYTPKKGFKGIDQFTYTLSDAKGGTDTAVVRVTVSNRP